LWPSRNLEGHNFFGRIAVPIGPAVQELPHTRAPKQGGWVIAVCAVAGLGTASEDCEGTQVIEIELTEPTLHQCDCCGKTTTTLVRFVRKDGDAHAVYYASFAEGHSERGASAVVSIGPWGEGADPADRAAFALRLWDDQGNFNVTVIDNSDSPWAGKPFLGAPLSREEAMRHPLLPEVFHITDHMFLDDKPLIGFFELARSGS
jgi:hypothetical protein